VGKAKPTILTALAEGWWARREARLCPLYDDDRPGKRSADGGSVFGATELITTSLRQTQSCGYGSWLSPGRRL